MKRLLFLLLSLCSFACQPKVEKPQEIQSLIKQLSDESETVRRNAAQALLNFFIDNTPVPALLPLYAEEPMHVNIGSSANDAVPALIRVLNDESPDVRQAAALTLGLIGQSASPAVPYLIPMLNDESDSVRATVASALGNIGHHAAEPALILALTKNHEGTSPAAARALGKIDPPAQDAVPILINMLSTANDPLRVSIIDGLSGIRTPEAIQTVIASLNDSSRRVRKTAIYQLARIGTPVKEIVPALFNTLADKDPDVRLLGAIALGRIGEPAIPTLIEGLSDEMDTVRKESAVALQHIRPAAIEAIPPLVQALRDENRQVRLATAYALKAIGTPEAKTAIEGFPFPPPQKVKVIRD